MQERFLKFDFEAVCRATVQEIEAAGWNRRSRDLPHAVGLLVGPTIYLCHYEAQSVLLVRIVAGGIEKLRASAGALHITFKDACSALGTMMDEIATKQRPLDASSSHMLSSAAAFYLGGTQAYRSGKDQFVDQYLIIRYTDASDGGRLLRPAATHQPGPLTPSEIGDLVVRVLTMDRANHPERFKPTDPLRFRPKPL